MSAVKKAASAAIMPSTGCPMASPTISGPMRASSMRAAPRALGRPVPGAVSRSAIHVALPGRAAAVLMPVP